MTSVDAARSEGANPPIELASIGPSDVIEALRAGFDDFMVKPSHYVFLALIYPIAGLILVVWASGGNALQLAYPLVTGFALLGPFAAIGLYEISRRRELGLEASWARALEVRKSPALPTLAALGAMLVGIFVLWLLVAQLLYGALYGAAPPQSVVGFVADLFGTGRGWALILLGNAIGFCFALVVLATTVIAFPLALDRHVGARVAVATSIRAVRTNPIAMLLWGFIIAVGLLIGAIPLLVGLAIVLPVFGHATWRLYRKLVAGPERG